MIYPSKSKEKRPTYIKLSLPSRNSCGSSTRRIQKGCENNINPRTDGGPGHLSTDGEGGADNRPRRSRKRSKLEASGKRHLGTDGQALQLLLRSFLGQVKNDVTGVKKVKMAALENKGVFLQITFELTELKQN